MKMRFIGPLVATVAIFALWPTGAAASGEQLFKNVPRGSVDISAQSISEMRTIESAAQFCRGQEDPGESCRSLVATANALDNDQELPESPLADLAANAATERAARAAKRRGGKRKFLLLVNCTSTPCYGTTSADVINGMPNSTTSIYAKSGLDEVTGGTEPDYVTGQLGNDEISGGAGADWLFGFDGADTIAGNDGWERVTYFGVLVSGLNGEDGWDELYGNPGNDWLVGGEGQDDLFGGSGDDFLDGTGDGGDKDILNGGPGNDDCDAGVNDVTVDC